MTTDSSIKSEGEIKRNESDKEKKLTAYEKVCSDVSNDERYLKELALGKRIGFYRLRGELGSGNFSRVKMGIHVLTKGTYWPFRLLKPISPESDILLQIKWPLKSWTRQSWTARPNDYCPGKFHPWKVCITQT